MHRSASLASRLRAGAHLAGALAVAACSAVPRTGPAATGTERPRNLILLVADGGGAATWSVAEVVRGADLAVASMPVVGFVETHNASGGVTDSAAGATAYAIAEKTANGAIAVDVSCRELWLRDSLALSSGRAACEYPATLLERAGGHVKTALVMGKLGVGREESARRLAEVGGVVARVLGDLEG